MKESLYNETGVIRTVSGHYLNVLKPNPDAILLPDIAHSLSFQCRFGGHLPYFYSVAEHSMNVARLVAPVHRLAALMHDASEAYLLDMPSPIKENLGDYRAIEENLMAVIAKKFDFEWPMPKEVKEADTMMMEREWHELMLKRPPIPADKNKPMIRRIDPHVASVKFSHMYNEYFAYHYQVTN